MSFLLVPPTNAGLARNGKLSTKTESRMAESGMLERQIISTTAGEFGKSVNNPWSLLIPAHPMHDAVFFDAGDKREDPD